MQAKAWSLEIEVLASYVRPRTIDVSDASALGLIPGIAPLNVSTGRFGPNWGAIPEGSLDSIVGLGATLPRDPITDLQDWRRVLREGGEFAIVPGRPGPPLWLIGLLNYVGGFEVVRTESIQKGLSWLVVARRSQLAEVRVPLEVIGPRLAKLAQNDGACRAELYYQIGRILLNAGDEELALWCFETLVQHVGSTAQSLLGLGLCRSHQRNWDEAEELLVQAQQLAPNDVEIDRLLHEARSNNRRSRAQS